MTVTLEQAKNQLGALIAKVAAGESVVITDDENPVAQLVAVAPAKPTPNKAGRCRGMLIINAEDDEHLKDFEECMPPKEN